MKFAIFLESSLLFKQFLLSLLFINKTLWLHNLKTRTAINAKISVLVTCVEAIMHLLLHNLHLKVLHNLYLHWNFFLKNLQAEGLQLY